MSHSGPTHPSKGARSAAYHWIRHGIADGSLPPGAWIREGQLADTLGVSRTPVREALYALASEGIVEIVHNRGARVSAWTTRDVEEVYSLRALLEGEAARLAAANPSPAVLAELRGHDRTFAVTGERLSALRAEGAGHSDRAERVLADVVTANEEFHRTVIDAAHSPRLTALLRAVTSTPLVAQVLRCYSDADLRRSTAGHHDVLLGFEQHDPALAEAAMRAHILGARHAAVQSAHGAASRGADGHGQAS